MTTFYADNQAKIRAVPQQLIENDANAVVKVRTDKWSLAGASVTNNDLVQIGYIPQGARLLPNSFVDTNAFGTSATIEVGTAASSTAFAGSTSVSSATRVTLSANLDYVADAGTPVFVKITNKGNATTLTLNAVLFFAW